MEMEGSLLPDAPRFDFSNIVSILWEVCMWRRETRKKQHARKANKDTPKKTNRQILPVDELISLNGKQEQIHFCSPVCYLVALSLLLVVNSTFIEVPENKFLERGSSEAIEMTCKSDCQCNLRWFLRKHNASEREVLYNGYVLRQDAKSYCMVNADEPGKCYLNLTNKPEAAKTYICFEPGTLAEASADLIWLSDSICNGSLTKDLVNLTCSVEFRGNWAPMMEWKEHSSLGEKVLSVGVYTDTVPNQRVTSTLVVTVQDGSRNYTCTTKFDISGKPNHTAAANIPDYNRIWMFPVLFMPQSTNATNFAVMPGIGIAIGTTVVVIVVTTTVVIVVYIRRKRVLQIREERMEMAQRQETDLPILNQPISVGT